MADLLTHIDRDFGTDPGDNLDQIGAHIVHWRAMYVAADEAGHAGECDFYETKIDELIARGADVQRQRRLVAEVVSGAEQAR